MYRILRRTRARGADRLVLLALGSYANSDGWCYPSLRTIARTAGVGLSTAKRALGLYASNVGGAASDASTPLSGCRPRKNKNLVELGEVEIVRDGHNQRDPVTHTPRPGGFQATHYYRLTAIAPLQQVRAGVSKLDTPRYALGVSTVGAQVCPNDASGSSLVNKSFGTSHSPAARMFGQPLKRFLSDLRKSADFESIEQFEATARAQLDAGGSSFDEEEIVKEVTVADLHHRMSSNIQPRSTRVRRAQ